MLNLKYLYMVQLDDKESVLYDGVKHEYYIYKSSVSEGFELLVDRISGNYDVYTFGSLSAAIAGIEALENGEEI